MLHMSPAAVGSSLGPTGGLESADEMHGCLHMHKGLNPHARLAVGVRLSALLCELSNKVVNASVEHLCGGTDAVICAVHDGTLLREAVEDESCVFGGFGEGKEQVVIGGIRGTTLGGEGASVGSFHL